LGAILLFVTFFNTYLDFYQEYKSAQILKSFMKLVPSFATVVRNGVKKEIATAEILPGDLIAIKNGDKVPADVRVIYINGELKVQLD
jgi:sodium/potassium-transporting ATPase subunit alpha